MKRAKKKGRSTGPIDSLNANFQVDSDLSLCQWAAVGVFCSHVGQDPMDESLHRSNQAIYIFCL